VNTAKRYVASLALIVLSTLTLHWVTASTSLVEFSPELLQRVESKWGQGAVKRLNAMKEIIEENQLKTENQKLKIVNEFFNLIPYKSDIDHWNAKDYWATPFEMLTSFGADCEDYSIAKYFTLRELGIDDGKLRITYVKALNWDEAHMVLTYSPAPNEMPLVLDNLKSEIVTANLRTDLIPVYSFNATGLWLAKERGTGQFVGSSDRLSLWVDMLERLEN
jgi:predicted transglutaminase-like cysteine proteinase